MISLTVQAQRRAPRLLTKVDPQCTGEANEAKTQWTVVVSVTIDEEGVPEDIRVVRSLGYGLEGKVVESVKQWRFEPGLRDGRPADIEATIEVNFRCAM